jgi:hypothetical protein
MACCSAASRPAPNEALYDPRLPYRIGLHRSHEAIAYGMDADRKAITRDSEKAVRRMTTAALRAVPRLAALGAASHNAIPASSQQD